MAQVRLFGPAREAFGAPRCARVAPDVGALLGSLAAEGGPGLAAVLARSRVWVNGEPAGLGTPVGEEDEVAVLPPVSGG